LTEHTYDQRAREIDDILRGLLARSKEANSDSGDREPGVHP
jgi:hypothetical protein